MANSDRRVYTCATWQRVAELFRPDVTHHLVSDGYVETLSGAEVAPPVRAQAAWQTGVGAGLYERIHPLVASLLAPGYGALDRKLRLLPGQRVADVGCGPGNVTNRLARAVAPHGLAVGMDLSAPMLARAAMRARPNTGLVRGDATRLPLRDGSVDAACATAVVMLVPEPADAVAELVRIVRPGGWLLMMVPSPPDGITAPVTGRLVQLVGRCGGVRMFEPDELPVLLEQFGCERIHSTQQGGMLTVRARTPMTTA